MIKNFKIFEAVKWYHKGKFDVDPNDEIIDEKFKVNDYVYAETSCYWDDLIDSGYGKLEKVGIDGKWVYHYIITKGKIKEISTCKNAEGYTGQIIKVGSYWPWFQITNFEKE